MSIEKKYNIKPEVVKQMVRDGVISCSVARHYEVFEHYCQQKSMNPTMRVWDLYIKVGDSMNVKPEMVKKIVYLMGKKS